jgi:protease I
MEKNINKNIAILATNGFDHIELTQPREAFNKAGAKTHIVADHKDIISWYENQWWDELKVDVLLNKTNADHYDMLFLPGGAVNPGISYHYKRLARDTVANKFIKKSFINF